MENGTKGVMVMKGKWYLSGILLFLMLCGIGIGCSEKKPVGSTTDAAIEATSLSFSELVPPEKEWDSIVVVGCNIKNYGEFPVLMEDSELKGAFLMLEGDSLSLSDADVSGDPWGEFRIKTETKETIVQFYENSQISIDGILYHGTWNYIEKVGNYMEELDVAGYGETE